MIGHTMNDIPLADALLAQGFFSRAFFPDQASTFAHGVDWLFLFIFWVSVFFFVLLMVLMVVFAFKYRRRAGVAPEPSPSHNTPLELTWSIVPLILMALMFIWGFEEYIEKRVAPADSEVLYVDAVQWAWSITYPNGAQSRDLVEIADKDSPVFALPNRPVKFVMNSADVIHSFYIPAFRMKMDVFPNRNTVAWVEPTKVTHRMVKGDDDKYVAEAIDPDNPGYDLYCTEYCGNEHSQMAARVIVMEEEDYRLWLDRQADTSSIPLLELGATLYKIKGCASCHSVDGSINTGPTWQGIWGKTHNFSNTGESAVVDFDYIRNSILNPAEQIVAGYPNQMASYQGRITEREIQAISTYIKSLTDEYADEAAAESEAELETQAEESSGDGADAGSGESQ